MMNEREQCDLLVLVAKLNRAILSREDVIIEMLRACQSGLEAAHDNYDGPNGEWVGFGTTVGPLLEAAIVRAEKCFTG